MPMGEQGWRSGENTSLPSMCPARCQMWVEFQDVGSRLAPTVFFRVLRFFSLLKNQQFQIPIREPARKPVRADVASSLNIIIYL